MTEETGPTTIQQRIAALKLNQIGRTASDLPPSYDQATGHKQTITPAGKGRPPPPPPPTSVNRPPIYTRTHTANNPPLHDHVPTNGSTIGNQPDGDRRLSVPSIQSNGEVKPALPQRPSRSPALPPRRPSEQTPALPPRRPSEAPSNSSRRPSEFALSRRDSDESISSVVTSTSGMSGMTDRTSLSENKYTIRAPEYDRSKLPPLPPKRTKGEKDAASRQPLRPTRSTSSATLRMEEPTPAPRGRPASRAPPPLPGRQPSVPELASDPVVPALLRIEPAPRRRSALGFGMNKSTETSSSLPDGTTSSSPQTNDVPPPVPTGSRPDLSALLASKPKVNGASLPIAPTTSTGCLRCRDFSGPDSHSARFPRQTIPSRDLNWLAHSLCDPFPSATDKARALFTWLHHNIDYNVRDFLSGNVKPSTPASTIATGLAVCEGYAALFAALALNVGLEAVVVSGHGKGVGHSPLQPGDAIPPYNAGHAWNAVRIDNGEWKLIDPCWGSGHLGEAQSYKREFAPLQFTKPNNDFGLSHYPTDNKFQYRSDGRIMGWEEYMLLDANTPFVFNGFVATEGIDETTFTPRCSKLSLSQQGPTVRFMFQKVCTHWDPIKNNGKPWLLYVLFADGLDGTQNNHIPFEYRDGVWWCDVPTKDLGRPGQQVQIFTVTTLAGNDGRGLTKQEYIGKKRRVAMTFGGVCKWELAP